ncbi:MAG: glutamyl-tRNA reductase [Deltaproteobacteria bacterium]|nr:glutamyl-tRNA reductase [Deltaproteobacteria bacterium]
MDILIVGLSHKTAPVEVREKISFAGDSLSEGLKALISCPHVSEALIVSTCNRVEIYSCIMKNSIDAAHEEIAAFLSQFHDVPRDQLDPHLYMMSGEEAVRHAFRVSSSLDSMMVGEPQILGQVKDAYNSATHEQVTGNILNRLLHKSFSVAKRIRTETRIATSAVSISFAAVELARKIFGDLAGKTIMLIGAGEMAELSARHLLANGVEHIMVANRTFEKAEALAEEFMGSAVPLEEIENHLDMADIVISSTGAPTTLIDRKMVQGVIRRRKHRPMFFIDIAVPRDIEPAVNQVENVYAYDIDDLEEVVKANIKTREKEAARAEEIVTQEVKQFHDWMLSRDVFPTIVTLKEWAEDVRRSELEKTMKRMEDLSEADRKRIEAMTEAILNKILHRPIVRIKRASHSPDGSKLLEAIREIFGLED